MRRFYRAVGINPAAVMQCVADIILVPNSDGAALDSHVDRQLGVTIPTDEFLGPSAKWLRNKRALVEPVKGSVRRWGWRRSRRRRWRCGDLGRRRGGGRRRWLRRASREGE